MSIADEPHIIVDNTMGAAFIGVICAASLYGVSCVQTWFYFSRYPGDLWYIKCLVAIVWVFDSIHQALISHTVYFYVVTNFSNPTEQANLVWSILLEVLFNGLIGFLVQSFLTMRVWKMSNQNKPLTLLIVSFVLGELGCSVAFTISSLKLVTWKDLTSLKSLSMTVNVLGAVSDVIIAAGLFYFLHRSRTGFKKSDTMISKLIMFTVSTGLLTSVCAVASLLSILIWGKTLIYVAFYFSLGRLYSNSLLATLNARKGIRGLNVEEGDNVSVSLQTFSNKLRLRPMRNMTMAPNQTNISIKVDTTQELVRDKATKEKDFEFDITDVGKSEDTQSEVV
ncbi:MAG: hypothetical protein NXY57DRAFT_59713 [Lentinula lateritia]|uniref:DUF6534 domain-containing protein n=1 Tax=Lentinula lateritia TaxID=40482 RepID=A0ABQ8VUK8_9AGAR|nr:MAG: hypothetical protein NXY57DRAFT_59713 [Lentinula lateritia]KAJ4500026.1 hypothetical protein C8R41DRAFT_572814 [Lentinula lateritia]